MSEAKQLDARMLQWQNQLGTLSEANRERVTRTLARSISGTVADLKVAYSKFDASEGASNRYTIESQTARYRELTKAAEGLMGPGALNNIKAIYESDLNDAYSLGTSASRDLAKIVDGVDTSAQAKISKMPIAAQAAAGQNLMQFWSKEKATLTAKVTEATLSALQRGKGWAAASRDIAQALRSDGQTILRGRDELSVTARNGIVMNLEQRADLIAKTEIANAYIQGQMAQYRKNGYEYGRWSATGERSCPFCVAREGNIYPLDELEGAIPAHPRCRCTIAPVLGENVKNVQNATDQEAAAALNLDDAGWTAIRQQRFSEFQKFTGKPMSDPAKYINTPTNRQKFLNPQAKGTPPAWMPSGKAMPDLNSVQAAAGRAAEQAKQNASEELTAEEKIVNDVMNDKRFKSDAQRTREMRARLGEAGLDRDLDFVKVAAAARAKAQGKSTAKDLEAQKAEAKKAEALKEADAKKANDAEAKKAATAKKTQDAKIKADHETVEKAFKKKVDLEKFKNLSDGDRARLVEGAKSKLAENRSEIQRLREEQARDKGKLKVIDAELKPIQDKLTGLESQREALARKRTFRKDLQKELDSAKADAEAASENRNQAFLKAHSAKSDLANAREKLANLKPGKKGDKFDLAEYDIEIANQNHSMASLKKIGQDVLRRAGVTLEEVKKPATGGYANLSAEELDYARKGVARAKVQIEGWKKNLARAKKNIRTTLANEEYALERAKRGFEQGTMSKDVYDQRVAEIKKNTKLYVERETAYIDSVPGKVKVHEEQRARHQRDLDKFNESAKSSAAARVIDELVKTSPLDRSQAKALVEEAAKRNRIDAGKDKTVLRKVKLAPVPKDVGLEHMIDAVQMYGTRSSMDVYGRNRDRANASTRRTNSNTGEVLPGSKGYVNSGDGYGDFRGTQFHELGHHLEFQNTDFYRASREFINSRKATPDESPSWLGGNYGRDEIGYKGKAYSGYVLKEYDLERVKRVGISGYGTDETRREALRWQRGEDFTSLHQKIGLATEVVAMGVEKLSSAYNVQRLAEMDSEHLFLSIGMVKVQQARAKIGMERFDRAKDTSTPVATPKDTPDGNSGNGGTEQQAKRLKADIERIESDLDDLNLKVKRFTEEATKATKKASDIFEETSKLEDLNTIYKEQELIEDAIMNLSIERSPLQKERRSLERNIESIEKFIPTLEP